MHRPLLAAILIVLNTLFLQGCGRPDREADLVLVSAAETNTLDPQKMSWLHDIRTAECLWEPLVRYRLPELTIEPAAARSWQVSDDGLTYTFHLRDDGRWSNGDPVTSHDFVAAWRRAMMPDFAADYAQLFFCIRGARDFFNWRQDRIAAVGRREADPQAALDETLARFESAVGIRTPDAATLVVELDAPTPYFLELCAFATFMPNHAASLARQVQLKTETGMAAIDPGYWTNPDLLITNGPYILKRYRFKRDLLVVRNDQWWNAASMRNGSILQRIIENPQTQLLTYQNGEADWLPDIPTALPLAADLANAGRSDVHLVPWAGTYFYSVNCLPRLKDGSPNPVADPRVRRALSLAIDRRALVEKVTRLHQPIARSFIPPSMIPGYEPPIADGEGFDPQAARKLLADAGYDDPARLKGISILYNTGGGHDPLAQTIGRMWQEHLGITVTLESMEVRSFRERLKNQQYTVARASWIGDYRDPTTFLDKYHSEGGNNDARWANPAYDRLLSEAAGTTDTEARMKKLRQAERILLDEHPILPIYHYITLHMYDPARVRGLHPNAWNFRRLELVEVK